MRCTVVHIYDFRNKIGLIFNGIGLKINLTDLQSIQITMVLENLLIYHKCDSIQFSSTVHELEKNMMYLAKKIKKKTMT